MSTAKKIGALVAKSLHSRLMVSYSLCSVAESEIRDGQATRAMNTLKTIRVLIGEIEMLTASPDSESSITERREGEELLEEVRKRAGLIETAIAKHMSGG